MKSWLTCRLLGSGTSLPEAIVALGLLAGAIVSTAALIVVGSRQVASAGRASRALAAAVSLVERLESRGFERSWSSLECDGREPICRVDSRGPAVLAWSDVLAAAPPGARAEISIRALDSNFLEGARAIRVTVVLRWSEGARRRSVRLVTIRT